MQNIKKYLKNLIIETLDEVEKSTKVGLNKIQQQNLETLLHGRYETSNKIKSSGGKDTEIAGNFEEDLLNAEFERTGDFDLFDNASINTHEMMREIVQGVKPLHNNAIVKNITGDSFGKIFKLANDHILKIFVGGVDPDEDMEWYRKCHDLLHSGRAKLSTLPVYDFGKIQVQGNFPVWYVEMAEVMPLDKYLSKTGRGGGDGSEAIDMISKIQMHFVESYFTKKIRDLNRIKKYVYEQVKVFEPSWVNSDRDDDRDTGLPYEGGIFRPLTDEEAYAVVEAFYDMVKLGFQLSDVAPRNMGALKQSSPADPKIIIFDR